MNLSKKAHLADLRESIKRAYTSGEAERHSILVALLECWKSKQSFLPFAPLLEDATDRDVQFLVADAFAYANDINVLKPLMAAAVAPANENYRSTFIWPCGQYDCTKHVRFFVDFMLTCADPGEAMLACIDVIEAMKGPFKPISLKANVRKLLGHTKKAMEPDMRAQHELFRVQAAYALLDKYYTQVDQEWVANRPKQ